MFASVGCLLLAFGLGWVFLLLAVRLVDGLSCGLRYCDYGDTWLWVYL